MNKIIGGILVLVALALAYMGITTINESTATVDLLVVDVSVSDDDAKMNGYMYLGIAVAALVGGVAFLSRKAN